MLLQQSQLLQQPDVAPTRADKGSLQTQDYTHQSPLLSPQQEQQQQQKMMEAGDITTALTGKLPRKAGGRPDMGVSVKGGSEGGMEGRMGSKGIAGAGKDRPSHQLLQQLALLVQDFSRALGSCAGAAGVTAAGFQQQQEQQPQQQQQVVVVGTGDEVQVGFVGGNGVESQHASMQVDGAILLQTMLSLPPPQVAQALAERNKANANPPPKGSKMQKKEPEQQAANPRAVVAIDADVIKFPYAFSASSSNKGGPRAIAQAKQALERGGEVPAFYKQESAPKSAGGRQLEMNLSAAAEAAAVAAANAAAAEAAAASNRGIKAVAASWVEQALKLVVHLGMSKYKNNLLNQLRWRTGFNVVVERGSTGSNELVLAATVATGKENEVQVGLLSELMHAVNSECYCHCHWQDLLPIYGDLQCLQLPHNFVDNPIKSYSLHHLSTPTKRWHVGGRPSLHAERLHSVYQ